MLTKQHIYHVTENKMDVSKLAELFWIQMGICNMCGFPRLKTDTTSFLICLCAEVYALPWPLIGLVVPACSRQLITNKKCSRLNFQFAKRSQFYRLTN